MANFDNIIQEINTNLPDNNTQSITAAKLRTTLIDLTNQIDTVQDDFENNINDIISGYTEVTVIDNLNSTDTDAALSAKQGNVLNEKINTINDTLYDTTQTAVDLSGKQTGFYNLAPVIGTSKRPASLTSGSFYTTNIACQAGETYIASSRNGGASMTQILIWDSNDYLVGYYNRGDSTNHYDFQFTIPQNGVLLSFCGSSSSSYRYELLKVTSQNLIESLSDSVDTLSDDFDTLSDSVDTLSGSVDTLSDDFDEITEIYVSPNMFDKSQVVEKLVTTAGGLQTVGSYAVNKCTGLIPVEPNKFYIISGVGNVSANNIRCLAANGTTAMKVLAPATGTEFSDYRMPNANATGINGSMNAQFKTPATAAYVQFNIGTSVNNDATNTAMIELVGDTYNPDFVPSAYEEYGSKRLIKESALPDIDIEGINEAIEKSDKAISRKFKVKLLLVGSSHGMNTISQVPWIAYNSGIDIEVGNVYIGSFSLQRMYGMIQRNEKCTFKYFKDGAWTTYTSQSFAQVFSFTDWDFISLQRSATDDQLWITTQNEADTTANSMTNINYNVSGAPAVYMSHNEALQFALDYIKANSTTNANIIFNTGFADAGNYTPTDSATTSIIETADTMKKNFGIEYYPTARAILNARQTFLRNFGNYEGSSAASSNNLCYDSQHLDYGIGCYVVGMCLLEFIFRKLGWDTELLRGYGSFENMQGWWVTPTESNYTTPTLDMMNCAKACAKAALNDPDNTSTDIANRFKWQIAYSFGSGVTSSNTISYCANTDKYTTTLSGETNVQVTSRASKGATPSDITSTVYDSSTHTITISSVEGDITITAN